MQNCAHDQLEGPNKSSSDKDKDYDQNRICSNVVAGEAIGSSTPEVEVTLSEASGNTRIDLFDSGSDRSYVTSKFVKRVKPKWIRSISSKKWF